MPKDKLHQIAYELLTTERSYVSRLRLLDQEFQFKITIENKSCNFMPAEVIPQMFSNIKPIYSFHNDFLLPKLEERMKNWSKEQKIGDIMANFAPFLKLYTEYVKNYDNAMMLIDKWTSQSPKFSSLLQEIQKKPECGQLTLQHHMLGPIQRVPRYELLLKDYLKRLEQDSPDRADTQKALNLVTEAAVHSNNAMKKLDRFNKLLNIIQRLNGDRKYDLISPTRELVKEGPITKISARSGEKQARYLFLFNDLLLVCSEQIMGSYKIRARLSVEGMTVEESENINIPNTFCLKCVEKTIEFLDEANNGNGSDWYAAVNQVLSDYQAKKKIGRVLSNQHEEAVAPEDSVDLGSQLGKVAPRWVKDDEVTMCMACQDKFTRIKRRHHCRACGKVFCGRCSSKKISLTYESHQISRVCTRCYDLLTTGHVDEEGPKRIVDVQADKGSILSSYINVSDIKGRIWSKRWIAIHEDFVMYFYKKNKDVVALQTLPLPGHEVKALGTMHEKHNVFCLTHKSAIVCYFQVDSEDLAQQWVRVLEKMVKLELPEKEEKRLSTHSTGSSHSTCSDQSSQS